MARVTPAIRELATQHQLGQVRRTYGPMVLLRVLIGLFLASVGAAWSLCAAGVVRTAENNISQVQSTAPSFALPSFVRYFPLFGLVFVAAGAGVVIRAAWMAGSRVAACDGGVAIHTRRVHDAFTWADVLTVTSRTDLVPHTYQTGQYTTTTTWTAYRRFTVHCHDGRTFALDPSQFGNGIGDLAQTIQVNQIRHGGIPH
jgi:hypothetical protein